MRLILGIMLAGWMIIIFWFYNQPATESSEISGTISYRLVEDTDEIFNWGLTTDQIGNIAGSSRIAHGTLQLFASAVSSCNALPFKLALIIKFVKNASRTPGSRS